MNAKSLRQVARYDLSNLNLPTEPDQPAPGEEVYHHELPQVSIVPDETILEEAPPKDLNVIELIKRRSSRIKSFSNLA